MAGDHPLELEVALAGKSRGFRPHGEAVPDRHDADVGAIDLVDQPHVGEDRRVAHMVNRLALARGNDEPTTGAEIDRAPLVEHAGGMPGRHEGEVEVRVRLRAAGIAWIDLLHAQTRHMHGKLIDGDERYRRLLANGDGVAGVILMAMGQRHVGHAFCHLPHRVARILEGRVSGEERIDQDARFARIDAEAGMAEPGDLHGVSRVGVARRLKTSDIRKGP
jgi:hypothetical protein